MLVCSCNVIAKIEIENAVISLLDEDAWQLITPGKIYHSLSAQGKCCGCFPNVINIIIDTTKSYHARIASPDDKIVPFIRKIKAEHERAETMRKSRAHRKIQVA